MVVIVSTLVLFVAAGVLIAVLRARMQRELRRSQVDLEALRAANEDLARHVAVREREAKLRAVFDSGAVPLVIWHVNGQVADANDAYLQLFGFTREELRRGEVRWTEIIPAELRRDVEMFAELASMGRIAPREIEYILRDGRRVPALLGGSALPGHPELRVSFVIDISERKRAEVALAEQLALTQGITDNATAALFMVDERGYCTFMNVAAEAMTGFTLDELRQQPLHDMIHHHHPDGRPFPASECPMMGALREGRPLAAREDVLLRKDGQPVAIVGAARPVVRAGRPASVVIEARDVTEQKRIEREREMLLDSERAARAEAERANRLKDDFVATLSHELRTPLNAVLGWAQLLRRSSRTGEQLDKGLETIERNARILSQLISDLLDVSRIASGKLRLEPSPLDLPAIIAAAVEDVRAVAEAKGIALHSAVAPVDGVVGDPARLRQVVWNLVSNAVTFTPRGGCVDVALARVHDRITLAIADTGQGIDPEFLPYLFERFRQADSSASRRHGGLGLGLSIVKDLVELHGGQVRAESAGLGRGARFVVELPIAAVRGDERAGPRTDVESAPWELPCLLGAKVLVVDDEPDARDLVRRMLEEREAHVVTAASAPEALEALGREQPDLLVSDIGMPGMDGFALIRAIRAGVVPEREHVPAVALTAFARPEDRQRALEAGFQAHLAKPVDAPELVSAAARLACGRDRSRSYPQC